VNLEASTTKPRRAWLAALLSLFGGASGQVYCGHLRRGIVLWLLITFIIHVAASSCAAALPIGRVGLALLLVLCVLTYPVFMSVDAFLLAKRDRIGPLKPYQKWWFYILFFITFHLANTGFAHGVKAIVAEAFVIPAEAMAPTLQPGDQILVDKLWFTPKRLKRNSLVVYRSAGPNSPPHIMRVVGLPGDEIEIRSEQVFVNGTKWDDEHANFSGKVLLPEMANYRHFSVPLDAFFVLGDNRRNANDSRFNGPIPLSDLIGRANIIYWSRERKNIVPGYSMRYEPGPIAWDRIGICFD